MNRTKILFNTISYKVLQKLNYTIYNIDMLNQKEIFNKLNDNWDYLRAEFNVQKIGLFGSYSEDTQTDQSDIDLLVDFSKPIGWEYLDLKDYLQNLFNKNIDLVTRNALKQRIKKSILDQVKYND